MPLPIHHRILVGLVALPILAGTSLAGAGPAAAAPDGGRAKVPAESVLAPATDCESKVGYNYNAVLPGYKVPDPQLGTVCLPFRPTALEPDGYQGDYRAEQFSFAAAQKQLEECKTQDSCAALEAAKTYVGSQFRVTGTVNPVGKIDPFAANVNLRDIRRPSFFAQAPYREPVAEADPRTYVFEMTAPADLYDQLNRDSGPTTKLRGWYIKGKGVEDAKSKKKRALAIFIAGRSIETTAIQDPADPIYIQDSDGKFVNPTYPSATTEKWGPRQWREYLYKLNQAGFDVLTFDKRGHGLSGGLTGDNVLNQGLDVLRSIDTLRTGEGLRVSGANGKTLTGRTAAKALLGSPSRAKTMPIILGGPSQGSWVTETAMNANFNRWCSNDTPGNPCHKPWGHKNIKGAVLLATLWGYTFNDPKNLVNAAAAAEVNHYSFQPTSEVLANIGSWPAVFLGKGIWDENGQTFGVFEAYVRARAGHKELVYVRGPHSENEQGPANVAYMQQKVTEFAVKTVNGRKPIKQHFANLRDALAASPPIWEVSTQPNFPR